MDSFHRKCARSVALSYVVELPSHYKEPQQAIGEVPGFT